MALLRVLLDFTHSSVHVVEETAGHVLAGMSGSATATFPAPPVTKPALQTGSVPETNYTFQVRALGGSTGSSDWSNPVSHMSL